MTDIQIMSKGLSNQIAAGEVIERPASVIKELVENAIDAGATQIDVRVEDAGLQSIEVVDNGSGMDETNAVLAFERHATSKLLRDTDLFRIRTLGFRGEALPSIASVSKMSLESSTGSGAGVYLELEGGEIVENKPAQARKGSRILVNNLFYNTPARLKYVKSLKTELSHISDEMQRFALSQPQIAFRLVSDDNILLKTTGNGDLLQAIAAVYGVDVAKKMITIEQSNFNYKITGYVSLPELTRSSRKYITLIINGRVIKNFALNRAIETGYGSKLMINRHPFAVIEIEMDPQLIDVNVHPTKEEVRISDEREVGSLIKQAVNAALAHIQRIPSGYQNLHAKKTKSSGIDYEQLGMDLSKPIKRQTQLAEDLERIDANIDSNSGDLPADKEQMVDSFEQSRREKVASHLKEPATETAVKQLKRQQDVSHATKYPFPELEYFGQMQGTYLFAQNEKGLYIIDQHAAQERIKYEYYRVEIGKESNNQQQLLVPIVLEYASDETITINNNLDKLAQVGLELESFGENTFIAYSHPSWFVSGQEEATIREMIDFFLDNNHLSLAEFREATAIMMSCKRSIKANHYLNDMQARKLLQQLPNCENPFNCPHGRPVIIHLSNSDMEKMFKRIQDH